MEEVYLLKKNKKGIFRFLFSRTSIILLLLAIAVCFLILSFTLFAGAIYQIMGGVEIFNLIVVVWLINSEMDSSAKITWILIVSATSIFGTLFYLYTRLDIGGRAIRGGSNYIIGHHRNELHQNQEVYESLKKESDETADICHYLNRSGTFPVTDRNEVTYYPSGEEKWKDMLEELRKAERFIFLEYFILEEGKMWGTILGILKEKAAQGVDVRVLYDGTCAISLLPYEYPKLLHKLGIKCKMFSPVHPFVSTHYNYRDHRKILVIDGKVGFTGGINLADEYINQKSRYGYWKDTAIRIKGEAVKSLTLMFLNMWSFGEKKTDYAEFLNVESPRYENAKGYVIPYGDTPLDDDKVGEKIYMNILNRANTYVHIMTPYLILDDSLLNALKFAAERGIDIKIILPGIPDKKGVHALAKTYFKTLLESGVKIYLYKPGFVHAKMFVSDDVKAVVGTINMDYRSLYHHFECAAYMYGTECIDDIERDFQNTLRECSEVSFDSIKKEKLSVKIIGKMARLVAPLL